MPCDNNQVKGNNTNIASIEAHAVRGQVRPLACVHAHLLLRYLRLLRLYPPPQLRELPLLGGQRLLAGGRRPRGSRPWPCTRMHTCAHMDVGVGVMQHTAWDGTQACACRCCWHATFAWHHIHTKRRVACDDDWPLHESQRANASCLCGLTLVMWRWAWSYGGWPVQFLSLGRRC